jgi:hypothetical protein
MKQYFIFGLIALVAVVVGTAAVRLVPQSQTGGDFPQGIVPSQLFTASTGTNSVTPVLSNLLLNGAVSVGGTAAANQLAALYTATSAYPTTAFNLGPVTAATSTTSTAVSFTAPGFSIGDPCYVGYNGATTTSQFGTDGFVTAVSGNAVTTTVTFWNGSSSAITFTVTSTATGASSTLKATCFHTGV